MATVSVFCGCSLDGFIAGEGDDLSWLPQPTDGGDGGFGAFLEGVGVIVMGRRTYDIVASFGDAYPYGELPLWVVTHRELSPIRPTVERVEGPLAEVIARACRLAGDRGVYLDGGSVVRQALDLGCVDEITVTIAPTILGKGVPLFAGVQARQKLEPISSRDLGGMTQIRYRVAG